MINLDIEYFPITIILAKEDGVAGYEQIIADVDFDDINSI